MKTRHLKEALCAGTLFAAALFATPAFATPITYNVILSANNPTVIEGNSGSLVLTLNNGSGFPITLLAGSTPTTVTGDSSDSPTTVTESQTCPDFGSTLGNGLSCTYTFAFDTPSAVGETDHDSGVTSGTASLTYNIAGIGVGYIASTPFSITVNDPPASTPEPSSLLLLSTGLIGIIGLGRKRLG